MNGEIRSFSKLNEILLTVGLGRDPALHRSAVTCSFQNGKIPALPLLAIPWRRGHCLPVKFANVLFKECANPPLRSAQTQRTSAFAAPSAPRLQLSQARHPWALLPGGKVPAGKAAGLSKQSTFQSGECVLWCNPKQSYTLLSLLKSTCLKGCESA